MLFIPTHLGAALLCASQLIAAQHDGAAAHQKPIAAPLTSGGVGRQGEKDKESPLTKEFDKRVEELLEQWHVPGLAIGIVDGDETWTKVNHIRAVLPYMTPRAPFSDAQEQETILKDQSSLVEWPI